MSKGHSCNWSFSKKHVNEQHFMIAVLHLTVTVGCSTRTLCEAVPSLQSINSTSGYLCHIHMVDRILFPRYRVIKMKSKYRWSNLTNMVITVPKFMLRNYKYRQKTTTRPYQVNSKKTRQFNIVWSRLNNRMDCIHVLEKKI